MDDPSAVTRFQAIQAAYDVLSDPQERAWYDDHRLAILRGNQGPTGVSSAGSGGVDIISLRAMGSSRAYAGFGDDDGGFYAVYSALFDALNEEELALADVDKVAKSRPPFGGPDATEPEVRDFYSRWGSFTTAKSFAWVDLYDVRTAPNARVRRAATRENDRVRGKARRKYNAEMGELIDFLARKDPRKIAFDKAKLQRAAAKKEEAARKREAAIAAAKEKAEAQRKAQQEAHQAWEARMAEELDSDEFAALYDDSYSIYDRNDVPVGYSPHHASHSDDDDRDNNGHGSGDDDDGGEGDSSGRPITFDCDLCSKSFKSPGQLSNHRSSKKHKKAVARQASKRAASAGAALESVLQRDPTTTDPTTDPNAPDASSTSTPPPTSTSTSSPTPPPTSLNPKDIVDEHGNPFCPVCSSKFKSTGQLSNHLKSKKHKRKQAALRSSMLQADANADANAPYYDYAEVKAGDDGFVYMDTSTLQETDAFVASTPAALASAAKADASASHPKGKKPRRRAKKGKATATTSSSSPWVCGQCKASFPTRNAMFKHIKAKGHAQPPR